MGQLVPTLRTIIAADATDFYRSVDAARRALEMLPTTGDACAQAQCEYCKRYGPLGSCQGCGAPNRPVQQPVGILTAPGTISDETASRLRRAWEAAYSGPGQSGRVAVLESGVRMTNIVPAFDKVKR